MSDPAVPDAAVVASPTGRWAAAQPWVSTLSRLVLGLTCLWAGAAKAGDLPASVRAVRAFELLPEWLAKPVGYGLPAVEIILGALLVVGLLTRYAAALAGLLMLAFVVGIAAAWARGLAIDCGCFGGGGPTSPDQTQYPLEIARDLGLAVLAAVLVRWPRSRFSLDQTFGLTQAS